MRQKKWVQLSNNGVVRIVVKRDFEFRRNTWKVGKTTTITRNLYDYLMKRYGFDYLEAIGGNEKHKAAAAMKAIEQMSKEEE